MITTTSDTGDQPSGGSSMPKPPKLKRNSDASEPALPDTEQHFVPRSVSLAKGE